MTSNRVALQRPHYAPALDVRPRAFRRHDDWSFENEFVLIELPAAFFGDTPQSMVVRRPTRLPTGYIYRIEEADVRRRWIHRAGNPPQIFSKGPQIRSVIGIDHNSPHRSCCRERDACFANAKGQH